MKIEISTNSWHYRMTKHAWAKYVNEDVSNSLCVYFWQVLCSPIIVLSFYTVILVCVCAAVFLFVYGVGYAVSPVFNLIGIFPDLQFNSESGFKYQYIVISLIFDALVVMAVLLSVYIRNRKLKSNKPNLVVEFIKAKKQKVCPLIEFKN